MNISMRKRVVTDFAESDFSITASFVFLFKIYFIVKIYYFVKLNIKTSFFFFNKKIFLPIE